MKKHYFVYGCSFFYSLGSNILSFSMIYRLTDWFSLNPGQIGIFIALGQFFYFSGCTLYHRFGSAFDPIKVFPCAAVTAFLFSIPLSYARAQGIVYVSYWVIQLGTGFYWPPVMAWLTAGNNEKELNREIGLFNRSWMGANILGPLIAGTLYYWNSQLNFIILNSSYFMVLLLLYLLYRYCRKHDEGLGEKRLPSLHSELTDGAAVHAGGNWEISPQQRGTDLKLDLYRYKGWISAVSSTLFLGFLANIIPLHIRDSLGYTERTAGLMLFFRSIAGFLGFSVLARFTGWHFNRNWFYILQAGLIAGSLILIIAGNSLFIFFGVAVMVGFCNSGCYNNSIFYSGATGKNPRKNLALHEIFLSIGSAIGSAGGGFIYQRFNLMGTCLILAMVLGIGLGVFILLNRYKDPSLA